MEDDVQKLAALRTPFPGESDAYRDARTDLLAQEIALQRQIDAVAEQRSKLPPGPAVEKDYRFRDMNGDEVGLADLFGGHDTLVTYFQMYGPERERPCPMCTNLLGPLDANALDITQRVALVVLARSPVDRQLAFARERGWRHLRFLQTVGDAFALDFGGLDPKKGGENPVLTVFRKDGDKVRLFWKGAMTGEMAEEGKDPRGIPDVASVWTVLDLTPGGRGTDWYPKLDYR
ncbi:DUF899 family protein [Qipengyuania sp.]|uniref:DUF899 family protein n=1 Tax=Qipengyuania sp. TaxID=2004515 RepID=UPI0035C80E3D